MFNQIKHILSIAQLIENEYIIHMIYFCSFIPFRTNVCMCNFLIRKPLSLLSEPLMPSWLGLFSVILILHFYTAPAFSCQSSEGGCRPRGKSDLHFSDVTPTTMHTFIYLTLCMYSIENRILTIIYTTHGIRHKTLYHIHM